MKKEILSIGQVDKINDLLKNKLLKKNITTTFNV